MANRRFPILFLAPADATGAILASGLLKRLHDEVEDARFTIVASAQSAPLFRDVPGLDALHVADRSRRMDVLSLWLKLRRRRWGLTLDAAGGKITNYLFAKRHGARRDPSAPPAHKVIEAARLLKLEDDPPAPYLFTSESTEARARELLGPGGAWLAMAPAARWVGAAWPVERFARTAVALIGPDGPLADARLLITGSPDDWREAESLRRSIHRDRWIDLTRHADPLLTLACLRQARLFIGGATPFTHLAAAAGAPTLGLFGPSDEAVEGPWGPKSRSVRGSRSFEAIRAADPSLDQSVCHMLDLQVESVTAAAAALLARTESGVVPFRPLKRA